MHGVIPQQEIERILFLQVEVELEEETEFVSRLRKGAGRDAIIEDVAPETHVGIRVRFETHPVDLGEDVAPWKEPDFVFREMDRRRVVVGGFVADAESHGETVGAF